MEQTVRALYLTNKQLAGSIHTEEAVGPTDIVKDLANTTSSSDHQHPAFNSTMQDGTGSPITIDGAAGDSNKWDAGPKKIASVEDST